MLPTRTDLYREVFAALCDLGGDATALAAPSPGAPERTRGAVLALALDCLSTLIATDTDATDGLDDLVIAVDNTWSDVVGGIALRAAFAALREDQP